MKQKPGVRDGLIIKSVNDVASECLQSNNPKKRPWTLTGACKKLHHTLPELSSDRIILPLPPPYLGPQEQTLHVPASPYRAAGQIIQTDIIKSQREDGEEFRLLRSGSLQYSPSPKERSERSRVRVSHAHFGDASTVQYFQWSWCQDHGGNFLGSPEQGGKTGERRMNTEEDEMAAQCAETAAGGSKAETPAPAMRDFQ
ncbi:uncharacterized protein RHO17_007724 [Thomomys bottae]